MRFLTFLPLFYNLKSVFLRSSTHADVVELASPGSAGVRIPCLAERDNL